MPRNWNDAIPEGNGPVSQQEEFKFDQPTLADIYRMIGEVFNESDRKLDELMKNLRATDQHIASVEHDARQPRLAMEADGPSDTKTCKCTEGAAKSVEVVHGDGLSANRVDPDPMCRFGVKAEPPPFPCRDGVLKGEQNRGKIWCSVQADRQAVSAPARFWERGARFFVGKFIVKALDEAAAFIGGRMTRES